MKVSVLVAVYKTAPAVLRDTIRSVLAQTCRDFELVILDDCPDDPREGWCANSATSASSTRRTRATSASPRRATG